MSGGWHAGTLVEALAPVVGRGVVLDIPRVLDLGALPLGIRGSGSGSPMRAIAVA